MKLLFRRQGLENRSRLIRKSTGRQTPDASKGTVAIAELKFFNLLIPGPRVHINLYGQPFFIFLIRFVRSRVRNDRISRIIELADYDIINRVTDYSEFT